MEYEQAERFLEAAQQDYETCVWILVRVCGEPWDNHEERRQARTDVLAAQQVLELARTEMHRAEVAFYDEAGTAAGRVRRKAPAP